MQLQLKVDIINFEFTGSFVQDGDGKVPFNTALALSYEVNVLSKLDKTLINI